MDLSRTVVPRLLSADPAAINTAVARKLSSHVYSCMLNSVQNRGGIFEAPLISQTKNMIQWALVKLVCSQEGGPLIIPSFILRHNFNILFHNRKSIHYSQ